MQATMLRTPRRACTLLLLLSMPLAASFSTIAIAGPTTTMTSVKSMVSPSPSTTRREIGRWQRLWGAADDQNEGNENDESKSISKSDNNNNDSNDASPTLMNNKIFTTIGKSTSAVVAVTFYVVLAIQRDALMVSFFIGAISNGILSKVLKKVLNQARPEELDTTQMELRPSDNGMPSSHAMSLGFIGTFTALCLPWTSPFLLGYVVLSLIYRVERKLHTVPQILVGVSAGSLNGIMWFSLCHGTLPFLENINVMDWVTAQFLNEQALLPLPGLAVPAILGAAIVGSVERRISQFLKQREATTKQE